MRSGPGSDANRQRLLQRLDEAWHAFRESYAGLCEAELMAPGVTGAWSVRDIIAHVTTWEEEALKHLPSILEGRRPPRYSVTYGGIDAFNAQMTRRKEGLSLSEVFRQQEEAHQQRHRRRRARAHPPVDRRHALPAPAASRYLRSLSQACAGCTTLESRRVRALWFPLKAPVVQCSCRGRPSGRPGRPERRHGSSG